MIVAERFGIETPTFQGEGPSCGHPALFIRLSRCNLTCSRCDTKYTWDWARFDPRKESTKRSVADLVAWAASSPVELVVITGGEPLIQQARLVPLVGQLQQRSVAYGEARTLQAGRKPVRANAPTPGSREPSSAIRPTAHVRIPVAGAGVRASSTRCHSITLGRSRRIPAHALTDFIRTRLEQDAA